jgi:hypothetical protein
MGRHHGEHAQRGITYIGLLALLIVVIIFGMTLFKLIPLYIEDFKVKKSLQSLAEEKQEILNLSVGEIEHRLMNRLSINDVSHVTEDNVKVTRDGDKVTVDVGYEVRVPLFLNLDIVANFHDNHLELGGS